MNTSNLRNIENGTCTNQVPCSSWLSSNEDKRSANHEEFVALIGESVNQLTSEERNTAHEELHGVSDEVTEDPDSVETWLQQIGSLLNAIGKKTAYETAYFMNRSYVTNRDFQMMFLRADRYDPRAASKRMIAFFDIKKTLFGEDKLVKTITLDDLDEEAKESLQAGDLQILPYTDMAGRRIVLTVPRLRRVWNIKSEMRAKYYITMNLLESQQTQKKGAMMVHYEVGPANEKKHTAGIPKISKLAFTLPVFWGGCHICCNDFTTYAIGKSVISILPQLIRAKLRIHYGSPQEIQYALSAFGIPHGHIPLSVADEPVLGNHLMWYRQCLLRERKDSLHSEPPEHSFTDPTPKDVLFGKMRSNGGNRGLRRLVKSLLPRYDAGFKAAKTEMTGSVVTTVQQDGGRFLKKDKDYDRWIKVSDNEACQKVAHMFRNARRASNPGSSNSH
jgi:hypothetical protein